MPELTWVGKDKVITHHLDVPYRVLECQYSFDESGQQAEGNGSPNMIIHGDNLEALKSLLPRFEGKIDCIYIDPPYNTGNEGWVYNDNVNDPQIKRWLGEVVGKEGDDLSRHDKWLCMMYPRLRLLHKLLSEDGTIFISIDDSELDHLRLLCMEIFGARNFVAQITLLCNPKGRSQDKHFARTHEYILVFSKTPRPAGWYDIEKDEERIVRDYRKIDEGGRYRLIELRNTHREFNRETRPNLWYPLWVDPKTGAVSVVQTVQHTFSQYPVWKDGFEGCWTWGREKAELEADLLVAEEFGGQYKISRKSYANTGKARATSKAFTIWQDSIFFTERGQEMFGSIFSGANKDDFPQPKSVDLVKQLLRTCTDENSLILDSYAGSGTTAQAVLELNAEDGGHRSFILIEMGNYAQKLTAERVKRVIRGYSTARRRTVVLFEKKITLTTLKNGAKVLDQAQRACSDASEQYDNVSKPAIKLSSKGSTMVPTLQVAAKVEADEKIPGTGGSFGYYELGQPLLTGGLINEAVDRGHVRSYIWFTETRSTVAPLDSSNPYFLGVHARTAYHLMYEPDAATTLNRTYLASLPLEQVCDVMIIYADICTLSSAELNALGVTFKKIPRDITRL
jgi:adenine specific DNA methylase mod